MPNNEVPISSFQDATGINEADKVTGLKNGVNTNFSFSTILSWFVQTVAAAFVPVSRKVNNKALSADISLDASDVGAQAAITASGILKGDGAGGVSAATAGTDYATPGMIPSVPSPSDSAPQDLASTAAAGSSGYYSRADHTHKLPSAADVGAISTNDKGTAGGVATLGNDGKVPSAQLPAIASTAADVTYDNTQSGLTADDVQEAIDELAAGGSATGKADEDTIAPVEDTTTATEAHALGSIFYLNGVLYRALSDIAIGGTINTGAGGNATQTKISENFKRTVTLTSAQYAQLSAAEKAADIVYIITDEPPPAISTSTPQMDGTAAAGSTGEVSDAGHVHPSDTTKANQSQLATVETGSTASRAYAVGEYFCWNGQTCRAKTAIAQGATLTLGTNYEVPAGGGLNSLRPLTGTVVYQCSNGVNAISRTTQVYSGALPATTLNRCIWQIVAHSYSGTYQNTVETDGDYLVIHAGYAQRLTLRWWDLPIN